MTEIAKIRHQAEKGKKNAQYQLANLYFNPPERVNIDRDYVKAMKWYLAAASQGHADAMNNIGFIYYKGLSVEIDDLHALAWFHLAKQNGSNIAKRTLQKLKPLIKTFEMEDIEEEIERIKEKLKIDNNQ